MGFISVITGVPWSKIWQKSFYDCGGSVEKRTQKRRYFVEKQWRSPALLQKFPARTYRQYLRKKADFDWPQSWQKFAKKYFAAVVPH